jgi:hypothetical protein
MMPSRTVRWQREQLRASTAHCDPFTLNDTFFADEESSAPTASPPRPSGWGDEGYIPSGRERSSIANDAHALEHLLDDAIYWVEYVPLSALPPDSRELIQQLAWGLFISASARFSDSPLARVFASVPDVSSPAAVVNTAWESLGESSGMPNTTATDVPTGPLPPRRHRPRPRRR